MTPREVTVTSKVKEVFKVDVPKRIVGEDAESYALYLIESGSPDATHLETTYLVEDIKTV